MTIEEFTKQKTEEFLTLLDKVILLEDFSPRARFKLLFKQALYEARAEGREEMRKECLDAVDKHGRYVCQTNDFTNFRPRNEIESTAFFMYKAIKSLK